MEERGVQLVAPVLRPILVLKLRGELARVAPKRCPRRIWVMVNDPQRASCLHGKQTERDA